MAFNFSLFGVNVNIDSLTGTKVDTGLVGVEVSPTGTTEIDIIDGTLVGVDTADGVTVDILGSELVGVDLTQGVAVDITNELVDVDTTEGVTSVKVANGLVDVDTTEGVASVEVADIPVDIDLTQGALVGVGEDVLFADLTEGVAIDTDLLTEAGIELPANLDI